MAEPVVEPISEPVADPISEPVAEINDDESSLIKKNKLSQTIITINNEFIEEESYDNDDVPSQAISVVSEISNNHTESIIQSAVNSIKTNKTAPSQSKNKQKQPFNTYSKGKHGPKTRLN